MNHIPKLMKCMVPETGLTINPIGEMVICCAGDNVALSHIKDIDDLTGFFNGEVYKKLRRDFKEKSFPRQCDVCWKYWKAGRTARFDVYNHYNFSTYEADLESDVIPIRFLEITTSNICNQMCVSCSGKYSSKWSPYEKMAVESGLTWRNENHKFHTEMYKMTKADVDKVLDIVPNLQHLTIKGGEPFADPNNIKILKKLAETNPNCRLEIVTNMQLVTNTVIEILHQINEVDIQASIDGVHEMYDWIRGGNFKRTVNNIKRYHEHSGRKVVITSTVSVYNWMHLPELIEYWKDIEGVDRIGMANLVTWPQYCSPCYLDEHHIEEGKDKLSDYLKDWHKCSDNYYMTDNLHLFGVNNVLSVVQGDEGRLGDADIKLIQERLIQWIDFCLVARENNEDIYELAPYLNDYRNKKVFNYA